MAARNTPSKGSKPDKEWRDALRLELYEKHDDPDNPGKKAKALRLVARRVVQAAINGDIAAAREIGDRLDGKATQTLEGSFNHNYVAEIPRPCGTAEEWSKRYSPSQQ